LSARLLVSCGEPSGDLYAGALTRELRALEPDISVAGLGGPELAAAGGHVLEDYRGLAVTGLTEAIGKIPRSLAILRRLVASTRTDPVAALVVIDFPDFNLPLARRMHKLGVPVVYYISPQLWAWRPGRMATMRKAVDRVLVIFPFEEPIYRAAGVPVEFVGHPLLDIARALPERRRWLDGIGLAGERPIVAILPGSRPNEVARILPDLMRAAALIQRAVPAAQFVVARAPNLEAGLFAAAADLQAAGSLAIVDRDADAALGASDVALVASGTATVQAALHGTPMVVVYRLSPATYRLGKPLVKVDTYAMVNLIAGRRVVPELIQDDFTPEAVAHEAVSMLSDPGRAQAIKSGLAEVRTRLGGPGASRRAALAILEVVAACGKGVER
jgi:lipid-A-disaccharide synthase